MPKQRHDGKTPCKACGAKHRSPESANRAHDHSSPRISGGKTTFLKKQSGKYTPKKMPEKYNTMPNKFTKKKASTKKGY